MVTKPSFSILRKQILMKHKDNVDVLQGGEHGRTALHLAAMYDHAECAEVIVSDRHSNSSLNIYSTSYEYYKTFLPQ